MHAIVPLFITPSSHLPDSLLPACVLGPFNQYKLLRGHRRNSDKALLGLVLLEEEVKPSKSFPEVGSGVELVSQLGWGWAWLSRWGQKDGLGGLPTPAGPMCPPGSSSGPCLCSWHLRSGGWVLAFSYMFFIICPNSTCMRLVLVHCSLFPFCCSRRPLSRCQHCSQGSQVPARLTLSCPRKD